MKKTKTGLFKIIFFITFIVMVISSYSANSSKKKKYFLIKHIDIKRPGKIAESKLFICLKYYYVSSIIYFKLNVFLLNFKGITGFK